MIVGSRPHASPAPKPASTPAVGHRFSRMKPSTSPLGAQTGAVVCPDRTALLYSVQIATTIPATERRTSTVSRTIRGSDRPRRRRDQNQSFRCAHCGAFVGPVLYGGSHRNHCPFCLYSRHVDLRVSGDRASQCGGQMAPIGAFTRPKGEHVIVHHCLTCGFERFNRIAADDDFALVLKLPSVPPRYNEPEEKGAVRESTSAETESDNTARG
jgi:hypothetical protein